jgi:Sap, sulfolipid-1-addressing protein
LAHVIALSFTAAANPTLIAVATLMLLLPNPKYLMLGYLCGALMTSITLGLVIVFAIHGSGTVSTTQHTLSPAADLALGGIALVIALVLGTGRDQRLAARRTRKRSGKDRRPPRWQQALSKGSPRTTFVIGAVLTLPGASYLVGLHAIRELNYATATTVLLVVGFNVVMLLLLELPLAGYVFVPDRTPEAVDRAKVWISRHWHRFTFVGLTAVGVALVIKGAIGLSS